MKDFGMLGANVKYLSLLFGISQTSSSLCGLAKGVKLMLHPLQLEGRLCYHR